MNIRELRYVKGIGEKRAEAYKSLGISSPDALLRYFPKGYINPGKISLISELYDGDIASVRVTVSKTGETKKRIRGLTITRFQAYDESGKIAVVYYNNPYTPEKLKNGDECVLYGRVTKNLYGAEITNPFVYPENLPDKLVPQYRGKGMLTSNVISKNIEYILENTSISDPLPIEIKNEVGLVSLDKAIREIHHPESEETLEIARERLIFDELFYFQLGLLKLKNVSKEKTNIKINEDFSPEEFYKTLPFEPTGSQRKAVDEALEDLKNGTLMNRLLQGDVGSGKTLVAAALILAAAKSGYQSVLMAPTEILAAQHLETLRGFLDKFGVKTALLSGSLKASEKRSVKESIFTGQVQVVIGTHAVIEKDVEFKNLGLVITDEQHRFGVAQRSRLLGKGNGVHCLVMSATPIPRTLALVMYSDLDISVLSEIPKGREKVDTFKIDSSIRTRALGFIRDHCNEGRNAYIVCPLIENNIENDLISIEEYSEMLKKSPVKDVPMAVLHGKMKPKEKDEVMSAFQKGEVKLLISTTVVEVGVDVPNANIMMIENAERFGLSQLHQLRGRVGRGKHKSYCILVSDSKGETAKSRLKAICDTADGFKIAEFDLKTRGPGDFFGNMQHGLPSFKIADLASDMRIVKKASEAASAMIKTDPMLKQPENAEIKRYVNELFEDKFENVYL